jgi:RHS repeat-associated protein
VTATYVYGSDIDDVVTMTIGPTAYYDLRNGLGSLAAVTDVAGNVVERYEYDGFGFPRFFDPAFGVRPASSIGSRYLYTGREYEADGLYYYRARHYASTHGRFIQRDPAGFQEIPNLFLYVHNNPVNFTDPYGLWPIPSTLLSIDPFADKRLSIKIKQNAKLLTNCGAAEFKVQWQIAGKVNGWVIQHVEWVAVVFTCDNVPKEPNNPNGLEFWEAWQVVGGEVFIGAKNAAGTNKHNADTFRTVDEGEGTKGEVQINGHVRYMPGYRLTEPPWGHDVPEAGDLPTRKNKPDGWKDEKAKVHSMTVKWICCKEAHHCEVSTVPEEY